VLVPALDLLLPFVTDGAGSTVLAGTLPVALPADVELVMQGWIVDPAGVHGFAATNGVRADSQ